MQLGQQFFFFFGKQQQMMASPRFRYRHLFVFQNYLLLNKLLHESYIYLLSHHHYTNMTLNTMISLNLIDYPKQINITTKRSGWTKSLTRQDGPELHNKAIIRWIIDIQWQLRMIDYWSNYSGVWFKTLYTRIVVTREFHRVIYNQMVHIFIYAFALTN